MRAPAPAAPRRTRLEMLTQPGRGLLALAGVLLLAGALQPWAVGAHAAGQPLSHRPTEGLGEGVYFVGAALLLLALAASTVLLETTNRLLQLVPLAAAVVCGAMWLNAHRLSVAAIEQWELMGGHGELTLGPWLVVAGVVATLAGAAWLEWKRPPAVRAQTRSLAAEIGLSRQGVIGAVIAALVGVAGGAAGVSLPIMALGIQGVLPGLLLGIFGFLIGVSLGGRLARRLVPPT